MGYCRGKRETSTTLRIKLFLSRSILDFVEIENRIQINIFYIFILFSNTDISDILAIKKYVQKFIIIVIKKIIFQQWLYFLSVFHL